MHACVCACVGGGEEGGRWERESVCAHLGGMPIMQALLNRNNRTAWLVA